MPRHRAPATASPKKQLRRSLTLSGVAVVATGLAVSSGIVLEGATSAGEASAVLASSRVHGGGDSAPRTAVDLGNRTRALSRSVQRSSVDVVKARTLSQESGGQVTETEDLTTGDPRTIARTMLAQYGFGADQFSCLDSIYVNESGWNVHADNPSSSAYGIPQALPGSKMASAGADWEDNAATQIRWGLGYIKSRYGTPCSAWSFKQGHGWY